MTTIQLEVSRDHLLQAIEQLDADELADLVSELLSLRARRYAQVLSHQETELFERINRWLTAEEQVRRARLQEKLEAETLTEQEHQELIELNEKAEWLNAQRVEALAELATLRQTTLAQLIHDLGLETPAGG
ncbi:MAG: STAS/SEC14 domain-containing protein [Chloroflexi bacterium]|nr:STAS/SEC14 domain-containing protein [Chloroflexota bacterium]MCI0579961.1 STAS/SEC14 domain-containing protein [Chloroflexota bacterium]MCI0647507.1 STAS/SEC14 domain-containing protein [Chloroflexota bacterium]MCI0728734.1 STAS/SEC14 domain-containing protein [Chloroflexota bacterium]